MIWRKKASLSSILRKNLRQLTKGTVIIRSHGVSRDIYEIIEKNGLHLVDATCPFVLKIHNIVQKESEAGKNIIIIGNGNHPEVEGIKGWCSTEAFVLESEKEAENFSYNGEKKLCVVSQTTFNYKKFQDLVEKFLKKRVMIYIVLNTICNATQERQVEARSDCLRGGRDDCHRRQAQLATPRSYTKYAKRNVKILTISRH